MNADWLADVLRGAGLIVEEVAGWQNVGHGWLADDGIVVVDHHTAGGPYGRAPSLATCIYGVPGVSGPLCNVVQTREPNGPDHFIVIAAGCSWNAGRGGWNGSSGNWQTIGLEVEHTGTEWYPDPERAQYTRQFNAAVLKHLGYTDAAMLCQHFEWAAQAGGGKIDIAEGVDPDLWRAQTTAIMQGTQPQPRKRIPMAIVASIEGVPFRAFIIEGGVISAECRGAGAPPFGLPQEAMDAIAAGALGKQYNRFEFDTRILTTQQQAGGRLVPGVDLLTFVQKD